MSTDLRDQLQQTLGTAITIDRELGGGGMSRVFVATDTTLGRQVVVKMLPSEAVPATSLERFNREIRTAAKLQHPHIVPVLSAGETGGLPFYTMPFVPGESLRQRLSKGGELSVNETVHILRDIAAALAYAHGEGVVHRDIKPENVMLSGGVAVVTDFGVAKAVDVASTVAGQAHRELTSLGVALGTPAYMSPEQATADPHVDHRSDIYSFGCVAYEMLAGIGLYAGRTPPQMLAAHVQETPEPLLKRRPSVPPALAALVMRCLEKRPGDRPQSAQELLVALDAIGTPSGGMQPTEARLAAARPRQRRTMVYVAAGVLLVSAIGTYVVRRPPPVVQFGAPTVVASAGELEMNPAISPDGKFVAYSGPTNGQWRIFVKQIGGGRPTLLTGDLDGLHDHPAWSPDGTQIVFEANGAAYVIPAFGGTPRLLIATDSGVVSSPAWSPDGSRLAYSDATGLWIRPVNGGVPTQRVNGAAFHSIAWSRDGRLLSYIEGNRANLSNVSVGAVWTVRADGGKPTRVTSATHVHSSPVFLPDGSLLYVSSRDGPPDVYQQALRGDGSVKGPPVRLSTGLFVRTISVTSDGASMAYDVVRNRSKIWTLPIPAGGTASMANATRVTNENERIEGMRLSHDGKWLAYDSDQTGTSQIYKLKLDGGTPVQLTTGAGNSFSPAWSPDDRHLTFHSAREGNRDIFIISADGGAEEQVTSGPAQDYWPDWSMDGKRIVYGSSVGTNFYGARIVERSADRRWSAPRTLGETTRTCARFSPDGARVVTAIERQVVTTSVGDGTRAIWWDLKNTVELPFACAWPGSLSTLYIVTQSISTGRYSFWAVPGPGGTARRILRDDPTHRLGRWDFETDGKRLFFTLAADESDIWVVALKR